MGGGVVTASSVISFSKRLEDQSAAFYRRLADRFPDEEELLLSLAQGCEKTKASVVRTYRETISDALEAGFSFEGLDLAEYDVGKLIASTQGEDGDYEEALRVAMALEGRARDFYQDVAKRSRSLLATIAMAFKSAARTRSRRRESLQRARRELTSGSS
jgi:rubrerythrin